MSEGRCLCGEVRFRVEPPFAFFGHCHCSMCRKHHGASFVTWIVAGPDAFAWLAGEDRVRTRAFSEHASRAWCASCGSKVPVVGERHVVVPAGNLTGALEERPTLHMFLGSRAPWIEPADGLPGFAAWPDPEKGPAPVERAAPEVREGEIAGSCLCGAVAFELTSEPTGMRHCHCRRCRLARGAAHATNLFGPAESLRFLSGEDRVVDYALPEAERFGVAFCRDCGGHVARVVAGRPYAVIPAGSLDGDGGRRPECHIFVGSKAEWFPIADRLPQHDEYPPSA